MEEVTLITKFGRMTIFGPQSQSRCVKIKFKVTTVFLQLVPLSLFALAEK